MTPTQPTIPEEESARPLVASASSNRVVWVAGFVLIVAGFLLFRTLEGRREALTAPSITAPIDRSSGVIAAPPDLEIPPSYDPGYAMPGVSYPGGAYPYGVGPAGPQPPNVVAPSPRTQPSSPRPGSPSASYPLPQTLPPPTMQEIIAAQAPYQRLAPPAAPEPPAIEGSASSASGKERVEAGRFVNPATTVPKGTVIQAVLETALDSNRPGFARAIVSRDVLGFDGSKVLVPRGSRIIGEYKSDVTAGQNRVLIQWQRLMRPDGVIINLDSPSADPLGRAGVKGKVNTHFFQRFAGAILQSALDIGTQLATREVSRDSIYIAVPGVPQGIITQPDKIQPTVRVRQGRSVSVFVARDLDFTKAS